MNKRASLSRASELFRPTKAPEPVTPATQASQPEPEEKPGKRIQPEQRKPSRPMVTGQVKHDQKITVYFPSGELFALGDATLELKRRRGINLDRGRLMRTAVALALPDLTENGAGSAVVAELNRK